jgi:diguanylate cyclase (GGDEF)-like protein
VAVRRGRALGIGVDVAVFAVGAALAAVAAARFPHGPGIEHALLLAVPVVVVIGLFPIRIHGVGGQMEFVCTPAVLIFLCFQAPPAATLALWTLAYAVYQALSRVPLPSKLFNTGLAAIAGLPTVAVVDALGTDRLDARTLVAVALGTVAHFGVDFVVTYVSLAAFQPVRLRGLLRDSAVWISLAVLLGAAYVGYTAVVLERISGYALLLIAPPICAVFVATRMYDQAVRHRARLEALFRAAVATHQAVSATEIEAVLVEQTHRLLHAPEVHLRAEPPAGREIGVPVPALDGRYLVATPRQTTKPYDDVDRESLATLVTIATESLDRTRLAADMIRMARTDSLTGLGNRAVFSDQLDVALRERARNPRPLALLYLDLDGFKSVNDRFGHDVGDALLVAVAQRIRSSLRAGSSAARIGGDEFVVLLADCPDAEVGTVCRRLTDSITRPVDLDGRHVAVGASIGAAIWAPGDSAEALMRRADRDMYQHKRSAVASPDDMRPTSPALTTGH